MEGPLTLEQFKKALPPKTQKSVSLSLMNSINKLIADPDMGETYRDNLLGYTQILGEGKFKVESYINAVKFVSQKLCNKTDIAAFSAAFPDRIQRFTRDGVSDTDIASYVSAYRKSKLVTLLFEQSMIPTWLVNQDLYQEALNCQADLMRTARSEKVRSDAAKSIMDNLKAPEAKKLTLDMTMKEDSSISQLRAATLQLVAQQRQSLQAGLVNAEDTARSVIVVEGEVVDD